jgi:uncharacterized membrane protein YjjP (DUF1212 family)
MQTGELMDVALKAGEILLTSGAEIYRVEDTVKRICRSYGAECESFVLPTGIFISVRSESDSDSLTAFKRIRQRSVDLYRVDSINSFSRNLGSSLPGYREAMDILEGIKNHRKYGYPVRLITAGIASFVFTVLFRGSLGEGLAAVIIGMLIYTVREGLARTGFFQFFELFVAGAAAGAAALLAVRLFPGFNEYKIIIGSIMIFLPGVAITNSIKDALFDDLVASLARMGEAVFTAVALGAGVGISLTLGLNWG